MPIDRRSSDARPRALAPLAGWALAWAPIWALIWTPIWALVWALAWSPLALAEDPDEEGPLERLDRFKPVNLDGWITRLWQPIATVGGLLDTDNRQDVVVVLHRRDALPGGLGLPVGSRALGIFALQRDGSYTRQVLAEGLLPCVECLGTFNREPSGLPFEIDIEGRRLEVSWIGNRDGLLSVHLTIVWDVKQEGYRLAADETVRRDPASGALLRHRRDFVKGLELVDGEERPMKARFVAIQDVKAEDYR
jgi:hypothetical protein